MNPLIFWIFVIMNLVIIVIQNFSMFGRNYSKVRLFYLYPPLLFSCTTQWTINSLEYSLIICPNPISSFFLVFIKTKKTIFIARSSFAPNILWLSHDKKRIKTSLLWISIYCNAVKIIIHNNKFYKISSKSIINTQLISICCYSYSMIFFN